MASKHDNTAQFIEYLTKKYDEACSVPRQNMTYFKWIAALFLALSVTSSIYFLCTANFPDKDFHGLFVRILPRMILISSCMMSYLYCQQKIIYCQKVLKTMHNEHDAVAMAIYSGKIEDTGQLFRILSELGENPKKKDNNANGGFQKNALQELKKIKKFRQN